MELERKITMLDDVEKIIAASFAFPLAVCLGMGEMYPVFLVYTAMVALLVAGLLWAYRHFYDLASPGNAYRPGAL